MNLTNVLLSTLDAHDVHARLGFVPMPQSEKLLIFGQSQHQPLSRSTPVLDRRGSLAEAPRVDDRLLAGGGNVR